MAITATKPRRNARANATNTFLWADMQAKDLQAALDFYQRVLGWEFREETDYHALRIMYEVRIVGGELRYEVDGTTDLAQWFPVADIGQLDRVPSIDTALGLYRTAPPAGILR